MIIYENTKVGFIDEVESGIYVNKIKQNLKNKMNKKVGMSETASWLNSLRAMKDVVSDKDIPDDAGIAIEYNIPNTSKRVDFIISGYDENKNQELVFIELKQWSKINKIESMDQVVDTYLGGSLTTVPHPSYQVWSYVELLKNSNSYIQSSNTNLKPCAYLHNYFPQDNDPLIDDYYKEIINEAPVFRMTEVKQLKEFIKKHIKYGDKLLALKKIEKGELKPSKSLQDCLVSMLKNNPEFIMIDEQKVIYEKVLNACRMSQEDSKKRVIIVKGGPGTGKTVVAINLLVRAINEDIYATYVTKNQAPRGVFSARLIGANYKKKYVSGLFMGSGSFTECESNKFGLLICDEAHRLNAKSGLFAHLGENQIKEIIHSSLTSVFFIDEDQRVTAKDIGSIDEIVKWVKKEKALYEITELVSQFRCGGSDGYLSWLDNTLEIRETANYFIDDLNYDFKVVDSAKELEVLIREKNQIDNKSRIVAGYCWNWISKKKEDWEKVDIVIDDFEMQWNLDINTPYAIDEGSINQVGCIHTCQGLEFSYVGVIIGPDIRYEDDKIITDFTKRAKTDKSLYGLITDARKKDKESLEKIDLIIKNTYRTLMSRGLKGCYIYCEDKALSDYFKQSVHQYKEDDDNGLLKVAEEVIEY